MSTESPTSEGFPSTPEQMPEPEHGLPNYFASYQHVENQRRTFLEEWEPGEPIYATRRGNYVRRIFQVLSDLPVTTYQGLFWCGKCDVLWVDHSHHGGQPEESSCWLCETPCPRDEHPSEHKRRVEHRDRACS